MKITMINYFKKIENANAKINDFVRFIDNDRKFQNFVFVFNNDIFISNIRMLKIELNVESTNRFFL